MVASLLLSGHSRKKTCGRLIHHLSPQPASEANKVNSVDLMQGSSIVRGENASYYRCHCVCADIKDGASVSNCRLCEIACIMKRDVTLSTLEHSDSPLFDSEEFLFTSDFYRGYISDQEENMYGRCIRAPPNKTANWRDMQPPCNTRLAHQHDTQCHLSCGAAAVGTNAGHVPSLSVFVPRSTSLSRLTTASSNETSSESILATSGRPVSETAARINVISCNTGSNDCLSQQY